MNNIDVVTLEQKSLKELPHEQDYSEAANVGTESLTHL